MFHISTVLRHYLRKDIQEAIVENAKDREVSMRYMDNSFGKRPDVLQYPDDVIASIQQNVEQRRYGSSFHASEERWHNPLALKPGMKKNDMDQNRKAWDLVIDVDCHFLEYSKIAADLIVKFLKFSGINAVSVKFSGRAGFHIGVPWECFPENIAGKETKDMFPEAPKKIALYMKERIEEDLSSQILKFESSDFAKIQEKTGKQAKDITREVVQDGIRIRKLDVEPFLDIDTLLISSRHLYRMPYCFNEKSGLVSVPVHPDKILGFDIKEAEAKNVVIKEDLKFLDSRNAEPGEARKLLIEALDFKAKQEIKKTEREEIKESREFDVPEEAVPEDCFPPCILNIFKGLKDGRKRSLFILVNFLSSLGWSHDQMKQRLLQWNKENEEPLREQDVTGRVEYQKRKKQLILPPNCDNKTYFVDIRVCTPDNLCRRIKNPVSYAKAKLKFKSIKKNIKQSKKQKPKDQN
jgi:hypothetical protein